MDQAIKNGISHRFWTFQTTAKFLMLLTSSHVWVRPSALHYHGFLDAPDWRGRPHRRGWCSRHCCRGHNRCCIGILVAVS